MTVSTTYSDAVQIRLAELLTSQTWFSTMKFKDHFSLVQ